LPHVPNDEVESLTLELARVRADAWDTEGTSRALETGFVRVPSSAALFDRLNALYRETSSYDRLARLCELAGTGEASPERRIALWLEAAHLYREHGGDTAKAAELLEGALKVDPTRLDVIDEYRIVAQTSGGHDKLVSELDRGIPASTTMDQKRALYVRRAEAKGHLGHEDGAIEDWEQAIAAGERDLVPSYLEYLEQVAARARADANVERFKSISLRTAELASSLGDTARAADTMRAILAEDEANVAVLRALGRLEDGRQGHEEALEVYIRLISLDDPANIPAHALHIADIAKNLGRPEDAKESLEWALATIPTAGDVRTRLEELYREMGAVVEMVSLYLHDAEQSEDSAVKFAAWVRAGALLNESGADPELAINVLENARAQKQQDVECVCLLSDAYLRVGRLQDAHDALHYCLSLYKGKRVKELVVLYMRLAAIAASVGDNDSRLSFLSSALDMDAQNGDAASELAMLAMEMQQWELASRALRTITMLKTPAPLSKALAYYHLGQVGRVQGDPRKAALFYKRALDEDPNLVEAQEALSALG
jgi:tetratricopeptide (TPR) repeat protein